MNSPCNCKEMIWMMKANRVFQNNENRWMLTWKELDRDNKKGINIEQFGVTINYCMFCGNKIT